ncbi:MAG: acyl-CoA dehydrogenase family protein [Hyphomonadaceae bacterium]
MDFNLPGEDDPRRVEIRKWFEANPKPTYAQMAEVGLTAPHWPEPWGRNADAEYQYIIDQEIERAGITHPFQVNPMSLNQLGQSMLKYGTEAQKARFLPPTLRCEEKWCMLFSEPSGGSDLANARTTARREGDFYIINGTKIWNSLAHVCELGLVVARTDTTVPKHMGLSQILIDMNAPGVTVRPIIDMTGEENEYNEVFLDNVKVPADRLLGQEGMGWRLAVEQLQTERAHMAKPGAVWGQGPTARELMDGLIKTGKIKDPLIREEAAKLYVEGEVLRLINYRMMTAKSGGKLVGLEGNIGKMLSSPHGQRMTDLAKRAQGPAGLVWSDDGLPLPAGKEFGWFDSWDYAFWFSPATTLGVGTQEILRNTVAERFLGLPRETDPTAKLPFNEARTASAKVA